jgi:hypothetical protein
MAATPHQRPASTSPASIVATGARLTPWIARAGWILVAVVGGSAVQGRSPTVAWTTAIGAWTIWAVVALGLAIASVRSLTIVRIGAPLAIIATISAALAGADAMDAVLLGLPAAVTVLAVMAADFGRQFVQASAYGDEERFPLRAPVAAGAAAIVVWLLWAPALVAGPLLLASRQWVAGVALTSVAVAGAVFLGPRWHRLSRRWFVLVPAGIVLHDPVVLADTLPLRTAQLAHIALAPADTQAADLTGPASGYAVEVTTTESVTAVFAFTPKEPNGRAIHLRAFLVAPTRPGAVLIAAVRRGLPVS